MKQQLRYPVLLAAAMFVLSFSANAKVWRVNNTPGVNADFIQVQTAVASAAVQRGDTLYVEGSVTAYASVTLNKKLVIIGPGYFLSGTGSNSGLQANPNDALFSILDIDSLGSGSTVAGIHGYIRIYPGADNVTITRSYIGVERYPGGGLKMDNIKITKCYGSINFSTTILENLEVTNCYIYSWFYLPNAVNALIRNNVIATTMNASNAYIANNIFSNSSTTNVINSTFKNNISNNNILPVGNGNQNNIALTNIFVSTGSTDGQYQLKAGSPAIGAGETVNGITPDCGMFGTADPYRLSGIPAIPTIYALTVPASVPSTATSMTITVSTRSNN